MRIPWKKLQVTKGRLNRMCKYFLNKSVCIQYEYNNSLGHHYVDNYNGKYDKFKLKCFSNSYENSGEVRFFKKNKIVFTFGIDCFECAEFYGLGRIEILNSGPYCYFSIVKRKF